MIKYTGKDIGKSKQILPVWNNDVLFCEGFFFFPTDNNKYWKIIVCKFRGGSELKDSKILALSEVAKTMINFRLYICIISTIAI